MQNTPLRSTESVQRALEYDRYEKGETFDSIKLWSSDLHWAAFIIYDLALRLCDSDSPFSHYLVILNAMLFQLEAEGSTLYLIVMSAILYTHV